jgi:hypothetical protein
MILKYLKLFPESPFLSGFGRRAEVLMPFQALSIDHQEN